MIHARRLLAAAGIVLCSGAAVAQPLPRPLQAVEATQILPRPRPPAAAPAASPVDIADSGPICGDATLAGTRLATIAGDGDCGVGEPVRLAAAAGVTLDPPATVDCVAARALSVWLRRGPMATFARQGAALQGLVVVDAYSCRNRNRAADGKLSEHAFGRAIDIAGFELRDGRTVAVLHGWRSPDWGPALHRIHDAGCGPFLTVLGPDANALHADHLHLDMASRRSRPYCE